VSRSRGQDLPGLHLPWTATRAKLDPEPNQGDVVRATRYRPRPATLSSNHEVPRNSVIAYFGGRNEEEIVVDPAILPEVWVTEISGATLLGPRPSRARRVTSVWVQAARL
jgi:hypothetical protein